MYGIAYLENGFDSIEIDLLPFDQFTQYVLSFLLNTSDIIAAVHFVAELDNLVDHLDISLVDDAANDQFCFHHFGLVPAYFKIPSLYGENAIAAIILLNLGMYPPSLLPSTNRRKDHQT